MKKHSLKGEKRELVGRKVKKLRAQNALPATVYGKDVESVSVTVPTDAFALVYKEAGETGLIELSVGESVKPVLIHNVQIDPVTERLLHVEFYQVNLKQKVHTKVPLLLVGTSAAVTERRGVLLQLLNDVEVEALPTELPEKIEVDISGLADVDQEVKVSDLVMPHGVAVLTDGVVGVAKIGALVSKEAEQQAAAEEAAAAEASTAQPAEGAAAAPTEAAPEKAASEKKPEEKKE
jgi:large subunit ribosomal protein L25